MPLFLNVTPYLDRDDPLYIFDTSDCRGSEPYCNEVGILGEDGCLEIFGYGLCAMNGDNNDEPPNRRQDSGYALKIWQAWKDFEGMEQEACAEAYL